ncbi:unnamed protein product [Rotaria socialis]|uniref:CCHC-type domain-containing protein n=2 Tax=Rotaria socialis TaxID=392032 RepID=A0A818EN44_9BILA|nr:unnamed protein product [Rotaria socialis]
MNDDDNRKPYRLGRRPGEQGPRPLSSNQDRIEKLATGKTGTKTGTTTRQIVTNKTAAAVTSNVKIGQQQWKITKDTLTVGTWNVQTLWATGKLELLRNEMKHNDKICDNDERIDEWTDPIIHNCISFSDNQGDNDNNQTRISNQAVNYDTDCHFPPLKIICTPKMQNQNGAYFVQTLIKHIKKKFKNENPTRKKLLAFDALWVNAEGDMMVLTKCMEIFIHLCILLNYAQEINNITIESQLPKCLPPPFSVLIKFVHNHISIDEIRQEVKGKYFSQYSCNELIGTKTHRTRHVRIDFTERNDYNTILNNGQISFCSQLYTVSEFLEAPKLLVCSKCNSPGHMKKQCRSKYDRCRRCGGHRIIGDHVECSIKCHHCSGEHLSTGYKCPILADYRFQLVKELKRHPKRLPEDVQLFIPAQCRDRNGRPHVITNYQKNEQKSRATYNSTFNMNTHS